MNIFMISLLVYTLHTSREREEAEARTSVENLASLLEKSVSSSTQEIDLSLYTLQTYIEKGWCFKKYAETKQVEF